MSGSWSGARCRGGGDDLDELQPAHPRWRDRGLRQGPREKDSRGWGNFLISSTHSIQDETKALADCAEARGRGKAWDSHLGEPSK